MQRTPEEAEREEDADVEQRFVEEHRLELVVRRVAVRAEGLIDVQAPRQARRPAEQLLVEVVAPAADRLRQRDADDRAVEERRDRPAAHVRVHHQREQTARDGAEDAQPAVPDVEDAGRVGLVDAVIRQHVVEPGADERDGCREQARPRGLDRIAAAALPQARGHHHPDEEAEQHADPVQLDVQRAEIERFTGGRGHGSQTTTAMRRRRLPARAEDVDQHRDRRQRRDDVRAGGSRQHATSGRRGISVDHPVLAQDPHRAA